MATVEGVFRIIDRASAPMARMERQARQTDRAIERLGMTTDQVGSQKQVRQVNELDRSYRQFGRTTDDTGGRVRRASRDLEQHERRWKSLKQSVTETGAAIRGMGAILSLLKLPVMGAGIGVLVQAVGALAGGVIALTPRVADLSGTFAALGPTIAGLGLAMVTTHLAFSDFGKALGGNKNAIRSLTPEARRFLVTLKEYRPVLKELRQSAQGGLFGGLDTALRRVQRGVPVANTLLRGMSATLGGLATQAANRFTTQGFLADLLGIGKAGTRGVGRGGTAIINIIDAMRHLTVAAIPFTDWITKALLRVSQFVERWAIFQRDSGAFEGFLNRTRSSLQQFGRIIKNLWDFVSALGRAARPLGDLLWRDVERGTRSWARYANSVQGQVRLTEQFVAMYPAIHEIVTLFDDLARTVFRMGSSGQLAGMVSTLDQLVPMVENLANMLVQAFGPPTLDLLTQLIGTLNFLVGSTGPITVFMTLLARILGLVNGIVNAVPGLGSVLATAFSVIAIGLFINRLRRVAAGWLDVAGSANAAAAAQARAIGVGGVGAAAVGGIGGAGLAAGGAGLAAGGLAAGETVTAGGVVIPAGVRLAQGAGAAGRLGMLSRLPGAARLGGAASRVSGLAGKFFLPVTAALGAYGALSTDTSGVGGVRGAAMRGVGGLNAASGGLVGGLANLMNPGSYGAFMSTPGSRAAARVSASQAQMTAALGQQGGASPNTYAQVAAQVKILTAYTRAYGQESGTAFQQAAAGANSQLTALKAVKAQLDRTRAEQSRATAYRQIRQQGAAWDVYAQKYGPVEATRRVSADVLAEMAKLQEPGRRILAQQYSSWLQEESQRNPKLAGMYRTLQQQISREYSKLGTNIRFVNGQIVAGTQTQWRQIEAAMKNPAERAREAVTRSFTQIQQKAVGTLIAMGVSPAGAANMVKAMERGSDPTGVQGAPIGSVGGKPVGSNTVNPHATGPGDFPGTAPAVKPSKARSGGPASGVYGSAASSLHSGIASMASQVMGAFPGLSMTSGVRPGDTGSYHSIGEAVDLSGPPTLMSRAAAWIRKNLGGSLLEGIHNSGLSIKNGRQVSSGFWGASTWAGHRNHIHLAAGDGGGAMGGGARGNFSSLGSLGGSNSITMGMLAPRKTGLRGVPGTLADQVGLLFAAGAASNLNKQMAGAGTSGSGTSGSTRKLAYSMMASRWPASEWSSLNALWTGESNFNPLARNPSSGAFGIPQALPASKMGAAAVSGDAGAQIGWGLNYIGGRYGTPTHAYQSWLSRKPHWYRDGGSATYKRPTLIGVGDNPRGEKVTVTPLGSSTAGGGGGGVTLQVNIEKIVQSEEGDTAAIVAREFELLAQQLERMPVVGDEEVMK